MSRTGVENDRRRAMGAYAHAAPKFFMERYERVTVKAPRAERVRGPEIGLVMLRGRAGGGGAAFNLGEASVTRATVRLASGEVGHAMILGRDPERTQAAAHLDALWQRGEWRARIEAEIVAPSIEEDAAERRRLAEETEATRVDFFTMVRGED